MESMHESSDYKQGTELQVPDRRKPCSFGWPVEAAWNLSSVCDSESPELYVQVLPVPCRVVPWVPEKPWGRAGASLALDGAGAESRERWTVLSHSRGSAWGENAIYSLAKIIINIEKHYFQSRENLFSGSRHTDNPETGISRQILLVYIK